VLLHTIYICVSRCNIPVILMGETGCGKTRLIKYMCELLSLNSPDSTTLVIMKVIYDEQRFSSIMQEDAAT